MPHFFSGAVWQRSGLAPTFALIKNLYFSSEHWILTVPRRGEVFWDNNWMIPEKEPYKKNL